MGYDDDQDCIVESVREIAHLQERIAELEGMLVKSDALHNGILLCSVTPMRNQEAIDNLTRAYASARVAAAGKGEG